MEVGDKGGDGVGDVGGFGGIRVGGFAEERVYHEVGGVGFYNSRCRSGAYDVGLRRVGKTGRLVRELGR